MSDEAIAPLTHQTARAALSSGLGELITRLLAVLLAIVTARALEPREVGLLALAVIVIGVISMIGYYPEIAAVAARGSAEHNKYALAGLAVRAAAVLSLLSGVALTFPTLAAYLVGKGQATDDFQKLIAILMWAPIIECLSGYPQVVLRRELELGFLAFAQVLQPVIFVGAATILLLSGKGFIAVAWSSLAATGAAFIVLWFRLCQRRSIRFEGWPTRAIWREIAGGSVRVFVGGFGGYVGARLDNLLVAVAIGPIAMSYYSMAWNASRTPTGIFSRAIGFVMVPTFARIQDAPDRLERGLRDCLLYSYLLVTPVCIALLVSAPDAVRVILGAKWISLVPALRVMCITVLAAPLLDASNALVVSTGRAQLSGISTGVRIVALLLIMQPLAHRWNVVGAAYGDMIAVVLETATLCLVARKALKGIQWPIASSLSRPLIASGLVALLAWGAGGCLAPGVARLGAQVTVFLLLYPLIVMALGGKERLADLTLLLRNSFKTAAAVAESRG